MIILFAAVIVAASPPPPPSEDPAVAIAGMEQVYAETCGSRGYGAYDDLCQTLSAQLNRYRTEQDRRTRVQGAASKAGPASAPSKDHPYPKGKGVVAGGGIEPPT